MQPFAPAFALMPSFEAAMPHAGFLANTLADALVASVWTGLLLAAGAWSALRLLPGLPAALRSWIWLGVLLAALALPLVLLLPHGVEARHVASSGVRWSLVLNERWSLGLVGLSLLLSGWRAVALGASALRLRTIARRSRPLAAPFAVARLLASAPRAALLCESDDVRRPSVAGFGQPRVLVPTGWLDRISESELEQIVLHELAHLTRRDDWTNLLQKFALAVFPLNPVLFWLDRRLSLERELACDDAVLGRTGARKAYAACLVTLAERSTLLGRGLSLALGAWDRQSELARRVQRILAQPARAMSPSRTRLASGVIAAGLAAGFVVLARAPQLVSFTSPAPVMQLAAVSAVRPARSSDIATPLVDRRASSVAPKLPAAVRTASGTVRMNSPVPSPPAQPETPQTGPQLAAIGTLPPSSVQAGPEGHAVLASAEMDNGHQAVRKTALAASPRTPAGRSSRATGAQQLTPQEWNALLAAWNQARQQHYARRVAAERELLQLLEAQPEPTVRSLEFQPTFAAVPTPDGWILVQL